MRRAIDSVGSEQSMKLQRVHRAGEMISLPRAARAGQDDIYEADQYLFG
jgi:hypothetical protein